MAGIAHTYRYPISRAPVGIGVVGIGPVDGGQRAHWRRGALLSSLAMTGAPGRMVRDTSVPASRARTVSRDGRPDRRPGARATWARRVADRWLEWADAPRQLGLAMVVVVVVFSATAGVTAVVLKQRDAALRTASERAGASVIGAQSVRADLSFADANSAALVFDEVDLDLGLETGKPARDTYDRGRTETTVTDSLAQAAVAIADLRQLDRGRCAPPGPHPERSRCEGALLDALQAGIPTYTDLVATARADNRAGQQVAQAYLERASEQMRNSIMPVADQLLLVASDDLTRQTRRATGAGAAVAVLLGACCLTALGVQILLFRRTRRVFDLWLLAGTAVLLLAVGAVTAGTAIERSRIVAAQADGYQPMALLAQTRSLVLRAHADENLSLISLNDGNPYEQEFDASIHTLGYAPGGAPLPAGAQGDGRRGTFVAALARLPDADQRTLTGSLTRWLSSHAQVVNTLANPDAPTETVTAGASNGRRSLSYLARATLLTVDDEEPAFVRLDDQLAALAGRSQSAFRSRMAAAAPPLDRLGWTAIAGTLVAAALALAGIGRRRREYAA
jgi:hypothetical protein